MNEDIKITATNFHGRILYVYCYLMWSSYMRQKWLDQWFSTSVPRHFSVPRNSENATVIYSKILKLCRDNKKVENHWIRLIFFSIFNFLLFSLIFLFIMMMMIWIISFIHCFAYVTNVMFRAEKKERNLIQIRNILYSEWQGIYIHIHDHECFFFVWLVGWSSSWIDRFGLRVDDEEMKFWQCFWSNIFFFLFKYLIYDWVLDEKNMLFTFFFLLSLSLLLFVW